MTAIEVLNSHITDCTACGLRAGCGQVVCGSGSGSGGQAPILFVAECPDSEADLMGEPLAGRAGANLRRLLAEAGLKSFHVTYLVKCMGDYQPEHLATCKSWLWKEIRTLKPRVIVPLGAVPTRLLLRLKKSFRLGDAVGRFQRVEYMSSLIAPWYGPEYLLQRGKKMDRRTIVFLNEVKLNEQAVAEGMSVVSGSPDNDGTGRGNR